MKEDHEFFKPLGSPRKEDPRALIDSFALIPDEFSSQSAGNYIQQLSEPGGVHSCLPTSALNALIHLGALSTEQARNFQETFSTYNRESFFMPRKIHGQDMLVFAVPVSHLVEQISQKGMLTQNIEHITIGSSELNPQEVKSLLKQQLSKGKLIVAGGSEHAVLVVGYKNKGQTLTVIDPNYPIDQKEEDTRDFVDRIQAGEPWINIFRLNTIENENEP